MAKKALIITEKPSVARDLSTALGLDTEHGAGEYWENDEYVCTYAVGHLLELLEPEDIDAKYRRWNLNNLPIVPENFRLKEKAGQAKRINVIRKLSNRPDIGLLINACDAAREGELIFQELVKYLEVDRPIKRLWLQSMTKEAILKGFRELRENSEVTGLADAAECRSRADWLIGMNASRALSIRLRTRAEKGAWSAGRVQTPTLGLLVDRELEILQHNPQPYWRVHGKFVHNGGEYVGTWYNHNFKKTEKSGEEREDRIFDQNLAENIIAAVSGKKALASETRKSRTSVAPGLFSLTALQKAMSNRYSWSAKRTLQAAQRCYETHKVLTYPRTSSSVLPADYKPEVERLIGVFSENETYGQFAKKLSTDNWNNVTRTFDDAGVTDHFAIIPTGHTSNLTGDDIRLYDMVVRRFLANFFPPAVYDKVERTTVAEGHHFRTGPVETLVVPGWRELYENSEKDQTEGSLIPLIPGKDIAENIEVASNGAESEELETKPPPRISEARLLSLMENAGRSIEDEELATALSSAEGLGTAATRADIIENLKSKEYVDENLRPTPKGIRLIDSLHRIGASRLTSASLTGQLELHLGQVEAGTRAAGAFMQEIVEYISEVVESVKTADFDHLYPDENALGTCPKCKTKQVYERPWFYACETNSKAGTGCGMLIWKDNSGRYMDRNTVKILLSQGQTRELDGFKNSGGQQFKAALKLEDGKVVRVNPLGGGAAELLQGNFEVNAQSLGKCPICEDSCLVHETSGAFVCDTRKKSMELNEPKKTGFILPRLICQREMSREEAILMILKGETEFITDFVSKRGRKFKAKLKMRPDGRHEFEFPPRAPRKKGTAEDETPAANEAQESNSASAGAEEKPVKTRATKAMRLAKKAQKSQKSDATTDESVPWE